MAHINRRYIDKHWLVFAIRGCVALIFGFVAMFGFASSMETAITILSVFLLFMGIIDSTSALYASAKKRGWVNSIIDASVDIVAALLLLFFTKNNLVNSLIIISVYTIVSGVIDIFHGFISTVDPTDRFIRILAGIIGAVVGLVILNTGDFEVTTFIRFFGAYMLIVGVTSLIYGIHNREQNIEDKVARSESRKAPAKKSIKKTTKKK